VGIEDTPKKYHYLGWAQAAPGKNKQKPNAGNSRIAVIPNNKKKDEQQERCRVSVKPLSLCDAAELEQERGKQQNTLQS